MRFLFFLMISYHAYSQIDSTNIKLKEIDIFSNKVKNIHYNNLSNKINNEELQKFPNFSISETIRYLPGVQLKDYGGISGIKTINIKGLNSDHLGVFFDSFPVLTNQNGQVDFNKFSIKNLDYIEINSSNNDFLIPAKSYFYANSLHFKTKKLEFNKKNYNLKVYNSFGDLKYNNHAFTLENKINKNVSNSFTFDYLYSEGNYKFKSFGRLKDSIEKRQNADLKQIRLENNLFINLNNNLNIDSKIYFYKSEKGVPNPILVNVSSSSSRQEDQNIFVQVKLEKKINQQYKFAHYLKYNYEFIRYYDSDFITLNGFLDNKYKKNDYYYSLINNYKFNKYINLSLSNDVSYENLSANLYDFNFPKRISFQNSLTNSINLNKISIQTSLLLGFFYDNNKSVQSNKNSKFLPIISFNYKPFNDSKFMFSGFYKQSFRLPTFNEMYYTLFGSDSLNPENVEQLNLGIYNQISSKNKKHLFDFQLDVYNNIIKDKIISIPTSNLFRWAITNVGKVDIKGINNSISYKNIVNKNIDFNIKTNLSFQEMIDVSNPTDEYYKNQIPYSPKFNFSFLASLRIKKIHINYNYIYASKVFLQKANLNNETINPWNSSDFSINYNGLIKEKKYGISFEINNVLNQYYQVISNFPMPSRGFKVSSFIQF